MAGPMTPQEAEANAQQWERNTKHVQGDLEDCEADADRLAKALRKHIEKWYFETQQGWSLTYTGSPDIEPLLAVLAQHDEVQR